MKSLAFGIAFAISAAILWFVCVAIVSVMPGPSMSMTGHMVHSDLSGMNWNMSVTGVAAGLVGWAVFAGLFGYIAAAVYNLLDKQTTNQ